jgi:hypothetical protein
MSGEEEVVMSTAGWLLWSGEARLLTVVWGGGDLTGEVVMSTAGWLLWSGEAGLLTVVEEGSNTVGTICGHRGWEGTLG